MRFLNIFGSSHTSARHGFPQTCSRQFSKMDEVFKSQYVVKEITSWSGATFYDDKCLDSIVSESRKQTKDYGYVGQVAVVILGSNDHREISALPPELVQQALRKFKYKLDQFLDRMLRVNEMTVVLVSNVLPKLCLNL